MTWFFMNFYATPASVVGDMTLMWKQFARIWTHALGNYRQLALEMFSDAALRKSLDQLQEVACGVAPIENFAREYFERFTVGLSAHNEGDIKIFAKALQNCKEQESKVVNVDHNTPGIILQDPMEEFYTITDTEKKALVDRYFVDIFRVVHDFLVAMYNSILLHISGRPGDLSGPGDRPSQRHFFKTDPPG